MRNPAAKVPQAYPSLRNTKKLPETNQRKRTEKKLRAGEAILRSSSAPRDMARRRFASRAGQAGAATSPIASLEKFLGQECFPESRSLPRRIRLARKIAVLIAGNSLPSATAISS